MVLSEDDACYSLLCIRRADGGFKPTRRHMRLQQFRPLMELLPVAQLPTLLAGVAAAPVLLALALIGLTFMVDMPRRIKQGKKRYHPVAATCFHQTLNFRRLHDYSTELARKHKTYRLLSPLGSEVFTSDPTVVEYILKTNFPNYGKGDYNNSKLRDLLGDGIFAVDGQKWSHQRKVSSLEFTKRALRDYASVVFRANAAKLASLLLEAEKCNKAVDIQDYFMKSTMDSIFQVAFGVQLNTISGSTADGARFAKAFDDSSALSTWRYADVTWKVQKFLGIGTESMLKKNIQIVDDFVYRIIERKIQQKSQQPNDPSLKEDILSRFLVEMEQDPENITPKYLRDIILNFLVAGKDTTAITLSWFMYMMCKHPAVQDKVAAEVIRVAEVAGNDTDMSRFSSILSDESMNKMQYLLAAVSETLRLYPAVPIDPKVCFGDDTLPDGYAVKKGDTVAYMPYAMGRMKPLWGDDAEEFKPERWLVKDESFCHQSPFKFTAFQGGPRICLGKEFAYRQIKIFAAVLLRFFEFKLSDEKKPVKYRTMLTLQIDGGLHVFVSSRMID